MSRRGVGARDSRKFGVCGRGEEVVVSETRVRLLHELAIGRVENGVVDVVQREDGFRVGLLCAARTVGAHLGCRLHPLRGLGGLLAEASVRCIEGGEVGGQSERAIDFWVFRVENGLVEVIGVSHICSVDRCKNVI